MTQCKHLYCYVQAVSYVVLWGWSFYAIITYLWQTIIRSLQCYVITILFNSWSTLSKICVMKQAFIREKSYYFLIEIKSLLYILNVTITTKSRLYCDLLTHSIVSFSRQKFACIAQSSLGIKILIPPQSLGPWITSIIIILIRY